MKFLSNRYAKVYSYKGFDICTLKTACPAKGDGLGYVIDDKRFDGEEFERFDDAVRTIDLYSIKKVTRKEKTALWDRWTQKVAIKHYDSDTPEYVQRQYYRCSNCSHDAIVKTPYCPRCGSKMDDEKLGLSRGESKD